MCHQVKWLMTCPACARATPHTQQAAWCVCCQKHPPHQSNFPTLQSPLHVAPLPPQLLLQEAPFWAAAGLLSFVVPLTYAFLLLLKHTLTNSFHTVPLSTSCLPPRSPQGFLYLHTPSQNWRLH